LSDARPVYAELYSIGTELTLGRIQDTNSSWMATHLTELGVITRRITILSDDLEAIVDALQGSLDRQSDLVIASGGLGPTPDDRTVEALCLLTGRHSHVYENIVDDYMRRRNVPRDGISEGLLKMATAPANADVQANPAGWAPCIRLDLDPTSLFVLPGPPREMEAVFTTHIAPYLTCRLTRRTSSLRVVVDMYESEVSPLMEEVMRRSEDVYLKAYVALREGPQHGLPVDIVASGPDETIALNRLRAAEQLFADMVRAAGKAIYN
jgi:nicotinamide-nucleotide amidase